MIDLRQSELVDSFSRPAAASDGLVYVSRKAYLCVQDRLVTAKR